MNAKQLEQPVFQAGPNRCKSDHGCQCWLNASCPRSSVRSERHRAKVEVAGASPAVDAILPLCLSSHRSGFVNRYSSVQVRPGAPSFALRRHGRVRVKDARHGVRAKEGTSLFGSELWMAGHSQSGSWCNSSTSRCERDGPGANPGFLTKSNPSTNLSL